MEALEGSYVCHHLWQVEPAERDAFVARVAPRIRGVVTNGGLGISGGLMRALPALEIVAVFGVGVDAVDLDTARARNVRVTNTPDVLTDDVADLAMALLLAANRRICALDRFVRSGAWEEGKDDLVAPPSLRGKTVGIYGFGRIGRTVARRLEPFGVELRYFQPRPVEGSEVPRARSLLDLAAASDYLVVCAAATLETRGAIDATVLRALGAGRVGQCGERFDRRRARARRGALHRDARVRGSRRLRRRAPCAGRSPGARQRDPHAACG